MKAGATENHHQPTTKYEHITTFFPFEEGIENHDKLVGGDEKRCFDWLFGDTITILKITLVTV